MPQPWEKQPNESPKAFRLFTIYRDLPAEHRSIAAAVAKAGEESRGKETAKTRKKPGSHRTRAREAEKLSAEHAWPARAAAWDEERDRIHRQAILDETETAARRHFEAARDLTQQALRALMDIPAAKDAQAAYFRAGAFARIMTALPKIQQAEREALGIDHKHRRESLSLPTPAFLNTPEAERPCHPRVERQLYQVLADGLPLNDAARIAGLDPQQVELWRAQAADGAEPYMTFAQNLERVEAMARHRLIREMRSSPHGATRAAPWLLERRYPEEYRLVDEAELSEMLQERDRAFEDRLSRAILRYVPEEHREEAAEEIHRAFGEQEDEDSAEE